jgi:GTPase
MKWRLREGQGEAIYEIGVEDSGILTGLSAKELKASLRTLQQMAQKLGATTTVLRERVVNSQSKANANEEARIVAEVLVRKVEKLKKSLKNRSHL